MAQTKGKQLRALADGHDDYGPGKASDIAYGGCIVMLDASGRAINGVAATGCIGVGLALTDQGTDRFDSTGLNDGDKVVRWQEGVMLLKNSGTQPFLSSDQPGLIVYIEDNETGSKTDQSSTLSPAGFFHHLDTDGLWVTMGKTAGALAKDMVTVTDAAAAHLAGVETFTGVKTFASSADPVFAKEANHTTNVVASTTATTAGGNLTIAAGAGATTGAGGVLEAKGGAGGNDAAGGKAKLTGGAAGGGNRDGGDVTLTPGAKAGSGVDGIIDAAGDLLVAAGKVFSAGSSQALSGAGTCNATTFVTLFTSTGGGQALVLANGTRTGQLKIVHHTVDGGSGILTPTSAGNFATFTLTAVHDAALFRWNGSAWDILMNVGGTVG